MKIDDTKIEGFDCVFGSELPRKSSFAYLPSLISGFAYSVNDLFKLEIEIKDLINIVHKV